MHNLAYTNNSISYMYNITKIISCNMNTIVYILDRIGQHLSCVGDIGNNATRMSHDSSDTSPSLSWNCSGTTFSQLTKFQGLYQALIRAQVMLMLQRRLISASHCFFREVPGSIYTSYDSSPVSAALVSTSYIVLLNHGLPHVCLFKTNKPVWESLRACILPCCNSPVSRTLRFRRVPFPREFWWQEFHQQLCEVCFSTSKGNSQAFSSVRFYPFCEGRND